MHHDCKENGKLNHRTTGRESGKRNWNSESGIRKLARMCRCCQCLLSASLVPKSVYSVSSVQLTPFYCKDLGLFFVSVTNKRHHHYHHHHHLCLMPARPCQASFFSFCCVCVGEERDGEVCSCSETPKSKDPRKHSNNAMRCWWYQPSGGATRGPLHQTCHSE